MKGKSRRAGSSTGGTPAAVPRWILICQISPWRSKAQDAAAAWRAGGHCDERPPILKITQTCFPFRGTGRPWDEGSGPRRSTGGGGTPELGTLQQPSIRKGLPVCGSACRSEALYQPQLEGMEPPQRALQHLPFDVGNAARIFATGPGSDSVASSAGRFCV